MKEAKRGAKGAHLGNAIRYILNPEKTKDGILVGGNVGIEEKEIYKTMLETKEIFRKEQGRQGYHFVVSFDKFEASEQQAFEVGRTFSKKYFGDNYEHVFAVHNDQEHMHIHFIFNSVSRSSGKKFHYKNGDWEKIIQPQVDAVCREHGLKTLQYDKQAVRKGTHYIEQEAKELGRTPRRVVLKQELDVAIAKSSSFEEVLLHLKEMRYDIRVGESKKQGVYFTILEDGKRGIRNYTLGSGYSVENIKERVKVQAVKRVIPRKEIQKIILPQKPKMPNTFQVKRLKLYLQVQSYPSKMWKGTKVRLNPWECRKQLHTIQSIRDQCKYLINYNITSSDELARRKDFVNTETKRLYIRRKEEGMVGGDMSHIEAELKELRYQKKLIKGLEAPLPDVLRKENTIHVRKHLAK